MDRHAHESCIHVAVRVLHFCVFILQPVITIPGSFPLDHHPCNFYNFMTTQLYTCSQACMDTYLTSKANARMPAARGAEALVPV